MTFRKGLTALGTVLVLATQVVSASAETLGQALTSAYNNSGLIEQNRALLRVADESVAQAVAGLRPVFSWTAQTQSGYGAGQPVSFDDWTTSLTLSGQFTVYDGGLGALAVDVQKENVLGARAGLKAVEQDVLYRAVQAYTAVQASRQFLSLRENNVRVLEQELQAAKDRFDVGEVTRTDVSLAEARLAAARSSLAVARGDLARATEEYVAAIGSNPGSLSTASVAPLPSGLAAAREYALQNHPSMVETRHLVNVSELNVNRADAALVPTVSLSGRLSFDEDFDDSGSISLSASQTFYAGGAIASGMRQAIAQRDASRSGLLLTTSAVSQNVANAFSIYDVSRAAVVALEQQVEAQELAFEGVREEANAGSRTTLEVLNAEQELLDARASLVSARADAVVASYAILSSMGLLTADHLGLNVEEYDVIGHYQRVSNAPAGITEQGAALDRILEALQK